MSRIRTGRPNGRSPLAREDKAGAVDFHANLLTDIIEKIDRLRRGAETRKDILMRIVREYPE